MKIVLAAEVSAARVVGGAERVLRNQAVGLAALGHQVELLTRSPEGTADNVASIEGIRESRYPVNRMHEAMFVWSSVQRSVQLFDRLRPTEPMDAVVIHQALAGCGPLMFRRHAASRWIYVCHSLAHEEYQTRQTAAVSPFGGWRRRVNGLARRWMERAVMTRCDRIVVLSDFMRRRVIEAHGMAGDRIAMIPGAADPQAFRPAADRRALRARLAVPAGAPLLFAVRNFVPRMGLEHLVEAVAHLRAAGRPCTLLIGGEGPLRACLEAAIRVHGLQDLVRLLGFVPECDLAQYYQAADLVVMPSLQLEGFGLVTVEAMACGTPVLGTPVGAIPEVLSQLDPMLVAGGTDSRSLAAALERMVIRLQQPSEAERLSRKARGLVEQRYNWQRHCRDLAALMSAAEPLRQAA